MNYKSIVPCFLFIVLLLLRFQSQSQLELQNGQLIRATGTLSAEPQAFAGAQRFSMGRILVKTSRYPEYHYGDRLEIKGKVKNNLLSYPEIKIIKNSPNSNGIKGMAIALNQELKQLYNQYFPQPLDGIVAGVVLGDKSLIPFDFWEQLKQTGTLHIMVASGMNIAFLAGSALSLLTLAFKRQIAVFFLFGLIWFYTIMTGLTPPVVRAAIMASLIYLSQALGRGARGERILLFTGGIMLFLEPLLLFDLGFQLSFLATAGLVFLQPRLQQQNCQLLRNENFSSSLSAQIFTLPVLVLNFGQLNLASPLINLAVLWLIPFVLQAGMLVGLLGIFWSWLGEISAYLLYPLLFLIEQIVGLSAKATIFQLNL